MISVLPMNREEMDAFILAHPACEDCDCIYAATESGKELGWFSAKEENGSLNLLQLQVAQGQGDEEALIAELLIRAAASYALNRYIQQLRCNGLGYERVLESLKFEKQVDGKYAIKIENLIHKCASCQK